MAYRDKLLNTRDKQDYYLAQIAVKIHQIYASLCDDKKKINLEDFMVKYNLEAPKPKEDPSKEPKEENYQEVAEMNKAFIFAALGID